MAGLSRAVRSTATIGVIVVLLAPSVQAQQSEPEGTEIAVRVTDSHAETKPSRSGEHLAWTQANVDRLSRTNVFFRAGGGEAVKLDAGRANTTMGSLDGSRLVYQRYNGKGSSIRAINLDSMTSRQLPGVNSRRWEFWPRADGNWVMFGRRVAGNKQRLMLVNTSTGEKRVLDRLGRNDYLLPGQINGDYVVWNVRDVGKKSKIKLYRISTGAKTTLPTGKRHNWGPSVTDNGTAYFGRSDRRCGGNAGLFRAPLGGRPVEIAAFPRGTDMGTSSAYENAAGKIEVFHDRGSCKSDPPQTDLFKVIDPHTVTLTVLLDMQGNATGSVAGAGITCGSDCAQDFEPGEHVVLTATPGSGDTFEGWSVASCGTEPTCAVTVTEDLSVSASFRP